MTSLQALLINQVEGRTDILIKTGIGIQITPAQGNTPLMVAAHSLFPLQTRRLSLSD